MQNKLVILVASCMVLMLGCGPDLRSDYDFKCGSQLTEEELGRFEVKAGAPSYNFEALKLLGKVSNLIFEENGSSKNYDVQFLHNDSEKLIIQVYELTDLTAIDKTACAVFEFRDYIFPKETLLLFYQKKKSDPKPAIVVGLRKK